MDVSAESKSSGHSRPDSEQAPNIEVLDFAQWDYENL